MSGICRLSIYGLIALSIFVIVSGGCATARLDMKAEHGSPIDEDKLNSIVIGKTTRSDVFKLLGTPHSMFQGQAEFQEGYVVFSLGQFYSHNQNRYLSSLDDQHYALLYRYGTTSSKSTLTYIMLNTSSNTRIRIRNDELLILFDKATDVVSDIAYLKETSAP